MISKTVLDRPRQTAAVLENFSQYPKSILLPIKVHVMIDVFLSHSNKDKTLAKRIANDLESHGITVWFDEWEISVGHSISQRIETGLSDARFVAVLLTNQSIKSGWVEKEWRSKIGAEADQNKIIILPIKGEECELPLLLSDKRYADFTTDYNKGFTELLDAVKAHKYNTTGGSYFRVSADLTLRINLIITMDGGTWGYDSFKIDIRQMPLLLVSGIYDKALGIQSEGRNWFVYWVEGKTYIPLFTDFLSIGIRNNHTLFLSEFYDAKAMQFLYDQWVRAISNNDQE